MSTRPVFEGLIFDENDNPVEAAYVGTEAVYVVNDAGFHRHIPSENVDRQVLKFMREQISGHEDLIGEQTAKMLGQEDIFSRAMIMEQLKQIDQQFEGLLATGIPADARAYLGMMGFKIIINFHGEVVDVIQPASTAPEDGE